MGPSIVGGVSLLEGVVQRDIKNQFAEWFSLHCFEGRAISSVAQRYQRCCLAAAGRGTLLGLGSVWRGTVVLVRGSLTSGLPECGLRQPASRFRT